MAMLILDVRNTPLGRFAALTNHGTLVASFVNPAADFEREVAERFGPVHCGTTAAGELLERFGRDAATAFAELALADERLTPFGRNVTQACRDIPAGITVTYAELAVQAGYEGKHARAVGGVMRRNPWPIIVPCHRVLGAAGQLTGYSAPGGTDLKARLLAHESRSARLVA